MSDMSVVPTALTTRINSTHAKVKESLHKTMKHMIECGKALIEAKDKVGHGHWLKYLQEDCPDISERMAQHYMRIARNADKIDCSNPKRVSDLSLRGVLDQLEYVTEKASSHGIDAVDLYETERAERKESTAERLQKLDHIEAKKETQYKRAQKRKTDARFESPDDVSMVKFSLPREEVIDVHIDEPDTPLESHTDSEQWSQSRSQAIREIQQMERSVLMDIVHDVLEGRAGQEYETARVVCNRAKKVIKDLIERISSLTYTER